MSRFSNPTGTLYATVCFSGVTVARGDDSEALPNPHRCGRGATRIVPPFRLKTLTKKGTSGESKKPQAEATEHSKKTEDISALSDHKPKPISFIFSGSG